MKRVWLASGLDPTADAGFMADQQAVWAAGVLAQGVVTALTAQNAAGVQGIFPVPLDWIKAQWDALLVDGLPDACKLGMTGTAEVLSWLLQSMHGFRVPVVLDPVHKATRGQSLADEAYRQALLAQAPMVALLTPNLDEVAWLLGYVEPEREAAAAVLSSLGFERILIKGGHGRDEWLVDTYYEQGVEKARWRWPARSGTYRGTGCRLAAAIAAYHARGLDWQQAIDQALNWLQKRMEVAVPFGGNPAWMRFVPIAE